jgi:hypothetical protein
MTNQQPARCIVSCYFFTNNIMSFVFHLWETDLYLIHSPLCGSELRQESWKAMEKLHAEGKVKSIGNTTFLSFFVVFFPISDARQKLH